MLAELKSRGLIHDLSHEEELEKALENESLSFYIGFDLTAPSLHVGSLIPLTLMRRLSDRGHKAIALFGTGTSKIGDPSGKSQERQLLGAEQVEAYLSGISNQIQSFLPEGAEFVKNGDWLEKLGAIEFLRDVGKHFSVNNMLAKESVRARLETRDQGISFTEFSYSLLQAYDFLELNRRHGCRLQAGGSDQWGNIVAGLDLIRRLEPGSQCFGITAPLLTTASGQKFGKTEKGAIWLDKDQTSPYDFYQFWLNTSDEDIGRFLRMFSFKPLKEIEELLKDHCSAPEKRLAQKALAEEMTVMLHGARQLDAALAASSTLFGGDVADKSAEELKAIFKDVPSHSVSRSELSSFGSVAELVLHCKILPTKGEAKRLISQGGLYVNSERVSSPNDELSAFKLIDDELFLIRTGKKKYHIVQVSP